MHVRIQVAPSHSAILSFLLVLAAADVSWSQAADKSAGQAAAQAAAPAKEAETSTPAGLFAQLREADTAFHGFTYEKAGEIYERITQANPYHGDLWLRLARCQEHTGQLDRAIVSFERGLELGDDSAPGQIQYQIAVLHARLGHVEQALDWLERSLAARLEHRHVLRSDKRLDELRSDPRFARLAAATEREQPDRVECWRRDLDHLTEEAARMHPGWREGTRPEQFQQQTADLKQRVAELSDEQMLCEIDRLMVLLGDGHSHRGTRGNVPASPRLPLRFYWFSDGLFIIDATATYKNLIGCRVDKFADMATADVEKQLATVISRDNPMGIRWIGALLLPDTGRLSSLGIVPAPGPVTLQLTRRDGQSSAVRVEPAEGFQVSSKLFASQLPDAPEMPLYLSRVEENLWFQPLADLDALYIQFNEVGNQKGRQLKDVATAIRQQMDECPPRTVIVDLRHNGGGNTYLYAPLLKALLYYEMIQPEGRVFVLISRNTFSAAQNFTNDVDRLTEAVFIGEPTGSRPSFVGESTRVVLPYSGIGLSISTRLHQHAYATDRRIWVAPDVPVELSSTDYFANRDPALEAIRAILSVEK